MAWNGSVGLIGMSGAGKTTLGRALAPRLGLPFLDLDAAIEREAGAEVRAIFESEGEQGFRARELRALIQAFEGGPKVVAIGAGAPSYAPSQHVMRGLAFHPSLAKAGDGVVLFAWLDAPDQEIARRLGSGGSRPLLAGTVAEGLARQRAARGPLYEELAALRGRGGRSGLKSFEADLRSLDPPSSPFKPPRLADLDGRLASFDAPRGSI